MHYPVSRWNVSDYWIQEQIYFVQMFHGFYLESSEHEIHYLLCSLLASGTWMAYRRSVDKFIDFRSQVQLPQIWPVPDDHVIMFISFLSIGNFALSKKKLFAYLLIFFIPVLILANNREFNLTMGVWIKILLDSASICG